MEGMHGVQYKQGGRLQSSEGALEKLLKRVDLI